MIRAHHKRGTATTAWAHRLSRCWALLAALLIFVGVAAPGPAPVRPAVEYSELGPTAVQGPPPQILLAARLQLARSHEGGGAVNVASAAVVQRSEVQDDGEPAEAAAYGSAAPIYPRPLFRHAYEAIGPPAPGLSQPA